MKKSIFAMMFTTAALSTACGGSAGTGSGPVDDAIAKAEEAVKIENTGFSHVTSIWSILE